VNFALPPAPLQDDAAMVKAPAVQVRKFRLSILSSGKDRFNYSCYSSSFQLRGVSLSLRVLGPFAFTLATLFLIPSPGLFEGGQLPSLKQDFRFGPGEKLEGFGHQARPAGLVAGAEAGPVVAVEIFIEVEISSFYAKVLPNFFHFLKMTINYIEFLLFNKTNYKDKKR
jgi:hypothetical protein